MRALINDSTKDVITEDRWLDWFGPDGEGLIARMPGYRLVEFAQAADPEEEPTAAAEPEPASVPDEKQQRIAALEQELAALRQTS